MLRLAMYCLPSQAYIEISHLPYSDGTVLQEIRFILSLSGFPELYLELVLQTAVANHPQVGYGEVELAHVHCCSIPLPLLQSPRHQLPRRSNGGVAQQSEGPALSVAASQALAETNA